ncbi:MAG: hypothetical protein IJ010_06805 [Ruminococcus sp.]|nr:hypothetical protein [Ruminococcus sp.]
MPKEEKREKTNTFADKDNYTTTHSKTIGGIVYHINSVFDMKSKSTAEDKLKFLLRNAAEKLS